MLLIGWASGILSAITVLWLKVVHIMATFSERFRNINGHFNSEERQRQETERYATLNRQNLEMNWQAREHTTASFKRQFNMRDFQLKCEV